MLQTALKNKLFLWSASFISRDSQSDLKIGVVCNMNDHSIAKYPWYIRKTHVTFWKRKRKSNMKFLSPKTGKLGTLGAWPYMVEGALACQAWHITSHKKRKSMPMYVCKRDRLAQSSLVSLRHIRWSVLFVCQCDRFTQSSLSRTKLLCVKWCVSLINLGCAVSAFYTRF